jgi:hypothetical protein
MLRRVCAVAAAATVLFAACSAAEAGDKHIDKKKLVVVSAGVGAGMGTIYWSLGDWRWKWHNVTGVTNAGAWAATTLGCIAVSPMVATVVLNRPLTMREGHIMAGSCLVPIIGGWLVEKAYEAHPEWDAAEKPAPAKKKHAKK